MQVANPSCLCIYSLSSSCKGSQCMWWTSMPLALLNTYSYARQVSFLCLVLQWIYDVKFIDGSHIHAHTIETNSSTQTAPSFRAGKAASSNYDIRVSYLQERVRAQRFTKVHQGCTCLLHFHPTPCTAQLQASLGLQSTAEV